MSVPAYVAIGRQLPRCVTLLLAIQFSVACADRTIKNLKMKEQPQLEFVAERTYPLRDTFLLSGAEFGMDSSVWIGIPRKAQLYSFSSTDPRATI